MTSQNIKDDLALKIWPFSAYSPETAACPELTITPPGLEVSPEELRMKYYEARYVNDFSIYGNYLAQLENLRNQFVQNTTKDLHNIVRGINEKVKEYNRPSGSKASGFSSTFGVPSTQQQQSAFGTPSSFGQQSAFSQPAQSAFGAPAASAFGGPATPSAFGAPSQPAFQQPVNTFQQTPSAFQPQAQPQLQTSPFGLNPSFQPQAQFVQQQQPVPVQPQMVQPPVNMTPEQLQLWQQQQFQYGQIPTQEPPANFR
jgi:nucleoporin NUP42